MRYVHAVVMTVVGLKLVALGAFWWGVAVQVGSTADAANAPSPATVPGDLLARSRGFRELLEAVQRRAQELDEREKGLGAREAGLQALEKAVEDVVARLEAAVGGAVAADGSGPGGGVAVTKIYAAMRPEEAAPILDRLDDETLQAIMGRMKERKIAPILAAMNPERAVALTKALSRGAPPPAPTP